MHSYTACWGFWYCPLQIAIAAHHSGDDYVIKKMSESVSRPVIIRLTAWCMFKVVSLRLFHTCAFSYSLIGVVILPYLTIIHDLEENSSTVTKKCRQGKRGWGNLECYEEVKLCYLATAQLWMVVRRGSTCNWAWLLNMVYLLPKQVLCGVCGIHTSFLSGAQLLSTLGAQETTVIFLKPFLGAQKVMLLRAFCWISHCSKGGMDFFKHGPEPVWNMQSSKRQGVKAFV